MRGAVLAVLAVLAVMRPAHADERAVIDQVVLEPSSLGGQRLKIFLSVLTLQGQTVDVGEAANVRVLLGTTKLAAPLAIGSYGATQSDTAMVIVVQTSGEFAEVLPVIGEAIDSQLLANANDRTTQVAVLTYGESFGAGKLGALRGARTKVTGVQSDGSVGEPALLDSIERALVLLKKADTKPEGRPLRKMIVVVGDGRDASHDRDRVVRVGKRAAKDHVRIHSMAFSPKDIRRPLLLLGELSKRSHGTFRWVRGARADSWTPALAQLAAEVTKQTVITVFAPAEDDLAGKKMKVQLVGRAELTSNERKIPEMTCNGAVCEAGTYCAANACITPRAAATRGVLGWILLIGGIIVGALFVLGLIGFVMTKREQLAAQVGDTSAVPHLAGVPQRTQQPQFGSQPPKTQALVPGAIPGAVPMATGSPRLYVMSGPYAGRELPLKHGFFVGKTAGCDLLLDDGYTSGHHAQFIMDGGAVKLFDYGSTNGTFVNGERITNCTLQHNATIKIGSTEMRFLAQ